MYIVLTCALISLYVQFFNIGKLTNRAHIYSSLNVKDNLSINQSIKVGDGETSAMNVLM
jgi:hypothetical protein